MNAPAEAFRYQALAKRAGGALKRGHSERSQYVKLSRIPEAGPGLRCA